MGFRVQLQKIIRPLVDNRIVLSLGMSVASGIVLNSMFPAQCRQSIPATDRVGAANHLSRSSVEAITCFSIPPRS
jgi:hypothetical protein